MEKLIIVALCLGFAYALYSWIALMIKLKKGGKGTYVFKPSLSQWIIHGCGICLLLSAAILMREKGPEASMAFFGLFCLKVVDFLDRNIQRKK